MYGGGGGGILKRYFGGDKIEPPLTLSSNASTAGYIERTFSSVAEAERENGDSRVFVGVHFQFASDEGTKAG